MKVQIIKMAVAAVILAALAAGDANARGGGRGAGNGGGMGNGNCTTGQQSSSGGTSVTRPSGSQRRDGTFLSTGVTANGSTTRPNNGNGPQDGSHLNAAPSAPAPTPTPAPTP